jgi:hypothetical protein
MNAPQMQRSRSRPTVRLQRPPNGRGAACQMVGSFAEFIRQVHRWRVWALGSPTDAGLTVQTLPAGKGRIRPIGRARTHVGMNQVGAGTQRSRSGPGHREPKFKNPKIATATGRCGGLPSRATVTGTLKNIGGGNSHFRWSATAGRARGWSSCADQAPAGTCVRDHAFGAANYGDFRSSRPTSCTDVPPGRSVAHQTFTAALCLGYRRGN